MRGCLETAANEERFDVGLTTSEITEETESIGSAAAREKFLAEAVAVGSLEAAILFDPFDGVGVQDLRPNVRVITGGVAAGEGVGKIRRAVAWWDRGEVDAVFF